MTSSDISDSPSFRNDTNELIARLRDYDGCHAGDVDEAARRLELLQSIVDSIPQIIDEVVKHCGVELEDGPSMYMRGKQWRYHRVRFGNDWEDGTTPLNAILKTNEGK